MRSNEKPLDVLYTRWVKKASTEIKSFLFEETKFITKELFVGCSVLDIGCGYGRTIKSIHKIPSMIMGVDNNRRMVQKAKLNLSDCKNVKIYLMDASDIKLNQKFDFVLCLANTFGNFSSKKLRILKEMKKVLKKDGKIIIHVYNQKSLKFRLKDYKKAGMPILKIKKDGTVYSSHGLRLEQFDKQKLNHLFYKAGLYASIKNITPISYLCTVKLK